MKRNKKGVTLIELIIVLSILGVIVAIVFTMFFSNKKTLNLVEIKSDLQYEAKSVMESISKYAMESMDFSYEKQGVSNSVDVIIFEMLPDSDLDIAKVIFDIKDKDIFLSSLDKKGNTIINNKVLSNKVKRLEIIKESNDSINLELTVEEKDISYSLKDNYYFRNKKK